MAEAQATSTSQGYRGLAVLQRRCPEAVLEVTDEYGEVTVVVDRKELVQVVTFLKDDHEARYTLPLYVTAVDYPDREPALPRFDILYGLRSLIFNEAIRLIVRVTESDPHVPSLEQLYLGMDWHERETYDLFGIIFDGHHDLRRILLPLDWDGHPLRKDYVSFGEPVAFTHNIEWALPEQERPDRLPGEER